MTNGELDRLVAEKVMGWHTEYISDCTEWFDGKKYVGGFYAFCPSDNLLDAWLVVKKMAGNGTQRGIVNVRGKYFYWLCYWKRNRGEAKETTMPKAICVAALRAVGENV